MSAIEERLVLFRARNGETALERAAVEGDAYAAQASTTNAYGQRVVTERLPHIEAFEMFDPPADGAEVFSLMEIVRGTESTASIVARKIGAPSGPEHGRMFIAADLARRLDVELMLDCP